MNYEPCLCGDPECGRCFPQYPRCAPEEHQWEEQPGEPPVDVCSKCGETRE